MDFLKRAWVEIDLDALKNNYDFICKKCNTKVIPVVKADAYGHSAVLIARVLQECGADMFAVSNILEAIELRESGIKGDILVLGYTPVESVCLLSEYDVTQCVYSLEYALSVSDEAQKNKIEIKAHLKLDTGMGRIGFNCRSNNCDLTEIETALKLSSITYTGVFAHFSVADSIQTDNIDFTYLQFKRFCNTVDKLEKSGYRFDIKHCCNSAASVKYADMALDSVRAGIVLYGLSPSKELCPEDLVPVMSMYSVVSMVKELEPENFVSYGRTYKAPEKRRIATISAGYADGVPRLMSNKGFVLINGKKAPVVGRVCMDQFCVDVTEINDIKVGDIAEIFGKNISVDCVADCAQTINYEIVCGISKRVPRISINN